MQPKTFQKRRKDNESHVYAEIDDTMVYGHLLQDSKGSFLQPKVDTYRPFQGPTGDCPPSPPRICSRAPTAKLTEDEPSSGFLSESESETYTFSYPSNRNISNGNTDPPLLETYETMEPGE